MNVQMEKSVSVTSLAGNLHDCDKCLEPGQDLRDIGPGRSRRSQKSTSGIFCQHKNWPLFPSESGLNDLKERRQIFVRIMVVGKENIGVKVCNNL